MFDNRNDPVELHAVENLTCLNAIFPVSCLSRTVDPGKTENGHGKPVLVFCTFPAARTTAAYCRRQLAYIHFRLDAVSYVNEPSIIALCHVGFRHRVVHKHMRSLRQHCCNVVCLQHGGGAIPDGIMNKFTEMLCTAGNETDATHEDDDSIFYSVHSSLRTDENARLSNIITYIMYSRYLTRVKLTKFYKINMYAF